MKTVNYIILGAGPAGCQLAYFLQKAGVDYSILERGAEPGTTFKKYPVHGKLISINKVHTGIDDPAINLRWDWNSLLNEDQKIKFGDYTKEYFPDAVVMVNYLQDFIKEYQLNVQYNTHISQISREGEGYKLKDKEGNEYLGQRLIVATGVSLPWVPDVPGIEHAKPYSELSLDKEEYTNKRVLILGKGNSAFETADYLTDTAAVIFACSPNHIKLAWSSHYVGHLRAVNNNFLDTYHLKSQNAVLDAHVLGIVKKGEEYHVSLAYQNETDESEVLVFDKIIAATGFKFDFSIFDEDTRPQQGAAGKYPAQTCEWESTNQPNMYFAGTITQDRDFKKYTSGFIHGFRYNVAFLAEILLNKYEGKSLPEDTIDLQTTDLAQYLLDRFNTTSCLWQQPGFMGDLILVEDENTVRHFPNVSVDYMKEKMSLDEAYYFIITMEFGRFEKKEDDHTAIKGFDRTDPAQAHKSTFLHPIVRGYRGGAMISEQHLMEDLGAEWKKQIYYQVMSEYVDNNVKNTALVAEEVASE